MLAGTGKCYIQGCGQDRNGGIFCTLHNFQQYQHLTGRMQPCPPSVVERTPSHLCGSRGVPPLVPMFQKGPDGLSSFTPTYPVIAQSSGPLIPGQPLGYPSQHPSMVSQRFIRPPPLKRGDSAIVRPLPIRPDLLYSQRHPFMNLLATIGKLANSASQSQPVLGNYDTWGSSATQNKAASMLDSVTGLAAEAASCEVNRVSFLQSINSPACCPPLQSYEQPTIRPHGNNSDGSSSFHVPFPSSECKKAYKSFGFGTDPEPDFSDFQVLPTNRNQPSVQRWNMPATKNGESHFTSNYTTVSSVMSKDDQQLHVAEEKLCSSDRQSRSFLIDQRQVAESSKVSSTQCENKSDTDNGDDDDDDDDCIVICLDDDDNEVNISCLTSPLKMRTKTPPPALLVQMLSDDQRDNPEIEILIPPEPASTESSAVLKPAVTIEPSLLPAPLPQSISIPQLSCIESHLSENNEKIMILETVSLCDSYDASSGSGTEEVSRMTADSGNTWTQGAGGKSFMQLSSEAFYRCGCDNGLCGFFTPVPSYFEMHLQEVHSNSSIFPCVHCGLDLKTVDHLVSHLDQHLASVPVLDCSVPGCPFQTQMPEEMLQHLMESHPRILQYSCWHCNSIFQRFESLVAHVRQNLLSVLLCKYCSAKHVDMQGMLSHISASHPGENQRVLCCPVQLCLERTRNGWWLRGSLQPSSLPTISQESVSPVNGSSVSAVKNEVLVEEINVHDGSVQDEDQGNFIRIAVRYHSAGGLILKTELPEIISDGEDNQAEEGANANGQESEEEMDDAEEDAWDEGVSTTLAKWASLEERASLYVDGVKEKRTNSYVESRPDKEVLADVARVEANANHKEEIADADEENWGEKRPGEKEMADVQVDVQANKRTNAGADFYSPKKDVMGDLPTETICHEDASDIVNMSTSMISRFNCPYETTGEMHSDHMLGRKRKSSSSLKRTSKNMKMDQEGYSLRKRISSGGSSHSRSYKPVPTEKNVGTNSLVDYDDESNVPGTSSTLQCGSGCEPARSSKKSSGKLVLKLLLNSPSEARLTPCSFPLQCRFCPFSATTTKCFTQHFMKQHLTQQCPACKAYIKTFAGMLRHFRTMHQSTAAKLTKKCDLQTRVREDKRSVFEYQCKQCPYTVKKCNLKKPHQMLRHIMQVHFSQKCPVCQEPIKVFSVLQKHLEKKHPAQAKMLQNSYRLKENHTNSDVLQNQYQLILFDMTTPSVVTGTDSHKSGDENNAERYDIEANGMMLKRDNETRCHDGSALLTAQSASYRTGSVIGRVDNDPTKNTYLAAVPLSSQKELSSASGMESASLSSASFLHPEIRSFLQSESASLLQSRSNVSNTSSDCSSEETERNSIPTLDPDCGQVTLRLDKQSHNDGSYQENTDRADIDHDNMYVQDMGSQDLVMKIESDSLAADKPGARNLAVAAGSQKVQISRPIVNNDSESVCGRKDLKKIKITSRCSIPFLAEQLWADSEPFEDEPLNGDKEYRCPHCTSDFQIGFRLYEHLCYHYHHRCFKCGHCGFLAFSKSSVYNHSQREHPNIVPSIEHMAKERMEQRIRRVMKINCVQITDPYTERRLKAYDRACQKKLNKQIQKIRNNGLKVKKVQPNFEAKQKIKIDRSEKAKQKGKIKSSGKARPAKEIKKTALAKKLPKYNALVQKWLICPYCRKEKKTQKAIEREICYHIHYKPYSCVHCEFTSSSKDFLQSHCEKEHPTKQFVIKYDRIEAKEERFKCLFERAVILSSPTGMIPGTNTVPVPGNSESLPGSPRHLTGKAWKKDT